MILLQLIGVLVVYAVIFIPLAIALGIFTKRKFSWVFGTALIGAAAIMLLMIVVGLIYSPTKPSKSEIIGHYEIDRSRYPGKQADWQHATYSLEITADRLIIRDSRTETTWENPIEWFYQPEYRWKFEGWQKRHHILAEGPALYRKPFSHYYVFRSPLYGDVFFKKK